MFYVNGTNIFLFLERKYLGVQGSTYSVSLLCDLFGGYMFIIFGLNKIIFFIFQPLHCNVTNVYPIQPVLINFCHRHTVMHFSGQTILLITTIKSKAANKMKCPIPVKTPQEEIF